MAPPVVSDRLTREDVARVYGQPLLELVMQAATVHRAHHDPQHVQCSSLLSIKTGACPEDCAYCPQSAHYATDAPRESLMDLDDVLATAQKARAAGASRFCMGAAWRDTPDDDRFARVLDMVRGVKALGLETCATLGMLDADQAQALGEAGLDYYNHNLDTSREYYGEVITTRTYDERLDTLAAARRGGLQLCCGGIVGMGESAADRIGLIHELAQQDPQPESVPINALVAVPGTPLGDTPPVDWDVLVRTVATARICMPRATVRLSAGRTALTEEAQALCFLAGAGSIFLGDRLLTTPNPETSSDLGLLTKLGLAPKPVDHR